MSRAERVAGCGSGARRRGMIGRGGWLFAIVILTQSVAAAQDALLPQDDVRPWLSINVSGHTAAVRALAFTPDSKRLCSAGLDKIVHVWNTTAIVRDLKRSWLLERSLRWQVGRGLRGSVFALATAPNDGLLAVGGYGAMGSLGEIILFDPVQGTQLRVLQAHRQTVASLAFSADGQWLASLDVAGQLIFWNRRDWQPIVVYERDEQVYGADQAALIQRQPNFRPLAMLGSTHAVVSVFVGTNMAGRPTWKLQRIGLANRQDVVTYPTVHVGMVSALALSRDGQQLASADLAGNLYIGTLGAEPQLCAPGAIVLSACFDPRGETLFAGTALVPQQGKAQLQAWDVATQTIKARRHTVDNVSACAVSPNGKLLSFAGGEHNALYLGPIDDLNAGVALQGAGRRVVSVAFARREPFYRIALGMSYTAAGFNNYGPLEQAFDPQSLDLLPPPLQADDWLSVTPQQGRWRVQRLADGALQLFQDNIAKGTVRFDARREGAIRCYAWISDAAGEPTAIAVGTDVQNSIFVCQLAPQGVCPILRHFRGHHDYVTALGVSEDRRYLVSGSADGTARIWSLVHLEQAGAPLGRWGADWTVEQDRLVASRVDPAGPLYFKGVRQGDVLTRLRWPATAEVTQADEAASMLQQLRDVPWETQVVFETSRAGVAQGAFQLLPAWQPLANLFVTAQREWAFWTPEGYYDASANGHTLFGWQVNRGLEAAPEFFRADQFRKRLERPDVLEHLLPQGSLERAFRQAAIEPPKRPDQAVEQQIAVTPRVSILSPLAGESVERGTATVRARIKLPGTSKLARAKVFANGVVAAQQRVVDDRAVPDGRELIYEWNAALPTEQQALIQVLVNTDAETVGFGHVLVENATALQPSQRLPKLYVLAMGINEYRDRDVQPLGYSVADAQAIVQLLKERTAGLYTLQTPTLLVNEQVTRTSWSESFAKLREQLRADARADDLLVIFMAGHGFVDAKTQRYYFAGHDISIESFLKGQYSNSISWSDFELLGDIPCRKLALLDTCHSGAIQPLRGRDLKSAVRAFQEDVVFTVTAAAGSERSEEKTAWQHGAFTKSLLSALSGDADVSGDGVVSLNEVVRYVQRDVPELTEGRQNPTAAPDEVLPFVSLRLTHYKRQANVQPANDDRAAPNGR